MKWEGGLSKDQRDTAAANPVPDGSGYHTNKGITWATWQGVFGISGDSINRFYKMAQKDWTAIFLPLFWKKMQADKINSQKVADILVNWAWAAGPTVPAKATQQILGLSQDGIIGPITLTAINRAPENELIAKLQQANYQFFHELGSRPQYQPFLQGWINRLNDLYNNYLKPKILPAVIIATILAVAILTRK